MSVEPDCVAIDEALLAQWPLPQPHGHADKEARGCVLVIAGSREIAGAAVLAGTAALRAGAGKLVVATPASAAAAVAASLPEARVVALPETAAGGPAREGAALLREFGGTAGAVLIGPGMVDRDATVAFVRKLLPSFIGTPVVLDALALDAVLRIGRFTQPVLLLPHAGEMAHLSGREKPEVAGSQELARAHAHAWGATLALKGSRTCVAGAGGRCWTHECHLPGLGTSGSGDVLAGLVTGLAARGATLEQAAVWGVALHARAGARLAESRGPLGLLARELAAEIPALMHELASAAGAQAHGSQRL